MNNQDDQQYNLAMISVLQPWSSLVGFTVLCRSTPQAKNASK